jgi:phage-related protein (TIGR01555 family)
LSNPYSGLVPEPSALSLQNSLLREHNGLLTEVIKARHNEKANSLNGLARSLNQSGLGGQDQITSLGPLYRSNQYFPLSVDFNLLGFLYTTHGVLQTLIDAPVEDAFSSNDGPAFELISAEAGKGSVGEGGLGELEAFAEETGAWEALKYTLAWGGLYGGSGLVINAGQDPAKPLDYRDVLRGNLEFYDADRWEFSGAYRSAPTFQFYGQTLDATRVITYGGKRAPRLMRVTLGGWGMSELQRTAEDFNMWLRGRNALYANIDKCNIDVYGIDGYADTLALPDGEQTMRSRLQATNSILNFAKALIIDGKDKYEVVSRNLTGVADVMKEIRIGLQGATRLPSVKIWGSAASQGLSAEGAEMELEVYDNLVTSRVRTPARLIMRKMLRLMMYAVYGKEYDVSFKFKPLRTLSAEAEERIKTSKTARYLSLYNSKLLQSDEMGKLFEQENLVPIETAAERGELPPNAVEVQTAGDMFAEPGAEVETPEPPAKKDEPKKKTEGGENGQPGKTDDA